MLLKEPVLLEPPVEDSNLLSSGDLDTSIAYAGLSFHSNDTEPVPELVEPTRMSPVPLGDPIDLRPGSSWGNFQLLRLIGEGAMGAVYEATDQLLNRRVAIKLLTEKSARTNAGQVERIIREARSVAKLEHPNIVGIYQVGQHGGTYFIAMQLVAGTSAGALADKGPLPVHEATRIILAAAHGLAAARAQGIIHRDIKPDNILLGDNGSVKIADFGLAKEVLPTRTEQSLSEGAVVGTPYYMSPEQARGMAVDGRSDLYSLGATWFYLLTGRPVFEGETTRDVLLNHVLAPVPNVHSLRAEVPEYIKGILERTLAKKPEDRYQNAEELIHVLEEIGRHDNPRPSARRAPAQRRRLLPVLALGTFLTYVAGLSFFQNYASATRPSSDIVNNAQNAQADDANPWISEHEAAPKGSTVADKTENETPPRLDTPLQEEKGIVNPSDGAEKSIDKSIDEPLAKTTPAPTAPVTPRTTLQRPQGPVIIQGNPNSSTRKKTPPKANQKFNNPTSN